MYLVFVNSAVLPTILGKSKVLQLLEDGVFEEQVLKKKKNQINLFWI